MKVATHLLIGLRVWIRAFTSCLLAHLLLWRGVYLGKETNFFFTLKNQGVWL
jgi:hypothetical protein